MNELEKTKLKIKNGNETIKEVFKLGFMACIESIEDKKVYDLAKTLRKEHQKI